ncbi:MAG: hypothetical protein PHR35_04365 [Kiritimatiellae bacterium]|nr:hypothetical protein [Kiritimatiellia bacterium]
MITRRLSGPIRAASVLHVLRSDQEARRQLVLSDSIADCRIVNAQLTSWRAWTAPPNTLGALAMGCPIESFFIGHSFLEIERRDPNVEGKNRHTWLFFVILRFDILRFCGSSE